MPNVDAPRNAVTDGPITVESVGPSAENASDLVRFERDELAESAGVKKLAGAIADSVEPASVVEELLIDQLAAAYRLAMKFASRSELHANNSEYAHLSGIAQVTNADHAVRFASASARMMLAFNDGVRALDRLRNGGQQTIVVQRVNVSEGGQAVISAGPDVRREGGRG